MRRVVVGAVLAVSSCAAMLSAWQARVQAEPAPQPAELLLGKFEGSQSLSILSSEKTPAMARATDLWKEFMSDRKVRASVAEPASVPQGPLIVFETLVNAPIAGKAGIDLGKLREARGEAHLIVAKEWNGRPFVLVVGKTDRGAEAGAWQLLSLVSCRVRNAGKEGNHGEMEISIPAMQKLNNPFIRGREIVLAPTARRANSRLHPGGKKLTPELRKKVNFELWDAEKLALYVQSLRAYGFNSIQLAEVLGYAETRTGGEVEDRDRITSALTTLGQAAHQQGMTVTFYAWPPVRFVMEPDKSPPGELEKAYEAHLDEVVKEYAELARRYGSVTDHLISHWQDPGPGGYAVPQKATVKLREEFRKYNPNVQTTLDVWNNKAFWNGDPRAKEFLDETFSPKDIGIALSGGYNAKQADLVVKAGRRLGIWMWYFSDYEMQYDLHLDNLPSIDGVFSRMPAEAGETVDWISVEKCWHALPSDVSIYVAAQKMWEPRRPLNDVILQYCKAVYGPDNADAMREVFQTITKATGWYKGGHGIKPHNGDAARKAVERLDSVLIAKTWRPNFPTMDTPDGYINCLREQLNDIIAADEGPKK